MAQLSKARTMDKSRQVIRPVGALHKEGYNPGMVGRSFCSRFKVNPNAERTYGRCQVLD